MRVRINLNLLAYRIGMNHDNTVSSLIPGQTEKAICFTYSRKC